MQTPEHLPYTMQDVIRLARVAPATMKRWTERRLLNLDAYAHADSNPERAWLRYSMADVHRVALMVHLVMIGLKWELAAECIEECDDPVYERRYGSSWMDADNKSPRILTISYNNYEDRPTYIFNHHCLFTGQIKIEDLFDENNDVKFIIVNLTRIAHQVREQQEMWQRIDALGKELASKSAS